MNAEYNAVKDALNRIDDNLDARKKSLLPSPYTEEQSLALYQRLIELVPVGTTVRATHIPRAGDISSLTTFEGKVTGSSSISKSEPFFHVQNEKFGILVGGSVLMEIPE